MSIEDFIKIIYSNVNYFCDNYKTLLKFDLPDEKNLARHITYWPYPGSVITLAKANSKNKSRFSKPAFDPYGLRTDALVSVEPGIKPYLTDIYKANMAINYSKIKPDDLSYIIAAHYFMEADILKGILIIDRYARQFFYDNPKSDAEEFETLAEERYKIKPSELYDLYKFACSLKDDERWYSAEGERTAELLATTDQIDNLYQANKGVLEYGEEAAK